MVCASWRGGISGSVDRWAGLAMTAIGGCRGLPRLTGPRPLGLGPADQGHTGSDSVRYVDRVLHLSHDAQDERVVRLLVLDEVQRVPSDRVVGRVQVAVDKLMHHRLPKLGSRVVPTCRVEGEGRGLATRHRTARGAPHVPICRALRVRHGRNQSRPLRLGHSAQAHLCLAYPY